MSGISLNKPTNSPHYLHNVTFFIQYSQCVTAIILEKIIDNQLVILIIGVYFVSSREMLTFVDIPKPHQSTQPKLTRY
jgi:hypothetical protein